MDNNQIKAELAKIHTKLNIKMVGIAIILGFVVYAFFAG